LDTALPNLHPALIHLPLAAIPLALFLDFAAVAWRQRWLDLAACLLWGVGVVGAAAAVVSGRQAVAGLEAVPASVEPLVGAHSDLAHQLLYGLLALVVFRVALTCFELPPRRSVGRLALLVAACLVQAPLVVAADRGGELVYGHGLAVASAEPAPAPVPVLTTLADPPSSRLIEEPQGGLTWAPAAGDGGALGDLLTAPEGGSLAAVQALDPPTLEGLWLRVDGQALLLLPGLWGDVEVEAFVDRGSFEGTIGLAHHVHGPADHDLLTVSTDGITTLAQTLAGSSTEQAATRVSAEPVIQLAVRASGSHLKGLVGGKLAVHGHVAPRAPGAVGLFLSGRGEVRVDRVRVTPLGPRPQQP